MRESSGQTHLIEALFAIILISGVMITVVGDLQPNPQLETTEDRNTREDIRSDAEKVIQTTKSQGYIKHDILNWNEDIDRMERQKTGYQTGSGLYINYTRLNSTFGNRLTEIKKRHSTAQRGVGINIQIIPAINGTANTSKSEIGKNGGSISGLSSDARSTPEPTPFMYTGSISQQSLVIRETIVLYGNDTLQAPPESFQTDSYGIEQPPAQPPRTKELHELTKNDAYPNNVVPPKNDFNIDENDIYNVVEVRTVIWF